MEERPPFTPPSAPGPPEVSIGRIVAGVAVGLVAGFVPGVLGLLTVMMVVPQNAGAVAHIWGIAIFVLLAIVAAWFLGRRARPGFFRGFLIGVAVNLLLTGGSFSSLLWVCRKGWV